MLRSTVRIAAISFALCLPVLCFAAPGQWHFKVSNKTGTRITKLEVSVNKKSWGNFDIGRGIAPGATMTLVWDSSTDDQPCEQWIRAKYSDNVYSDPSKQDFCEDLDEPIEFTEE